MYKAFFFFLACYLLENVVVTFPPTVVPCILMLSRLLFIYFFNPTATQLDCSKRMLKFTLKCSYMFQFNNHHQGATIRTLLKL